MLESEIETLVFELGRGLEMVEELFSEEPIIAFLQNPKSTNSSSPAVVPQSPPPLAADVATFLHPPPPPDVDLQFGGLIWRLKSG